MLLIFFVNKSYKILNDLGIIGIKWITDKVRLGSLQHGQSCHCYQLVVIFIIRDIKVNFVMIKH